MSKELWDLDTDPLPTIMATDAQYVKIESETNVENKQELLLQTHNRSAYVGWRDSFLEVEVQITKSDGSDLTEADHTALASNSCAPFKNMALYINEAEIHRANDVSVSNHMYHLTTKSKEFFDSLDQNAHNFLDSVSDKGETATMAYTAGVVEGANATATGYTPVDWTTEVQAHRNNGEASVNGVRKNPNFDPAMAKKVARSTSAQRLFVRLVDVFPELDVDFVSKGMSVKLTAQKSTDAASIFGSNSTAKLLIKKFRLHALHYRPTREAEVMYEKAIAANPKVKHEFERFNLHSLLVAQPSIGTQNWNVLVKQRRPTMAIVGFQWNDRSTDNRLNPLEFDLLGTDNESALSQVVLQVDGKSYPSRPYRVENKEEQARILSEYYRVSKRYDNLMGGSPINRDNWGTVFPLFVFDLEALERNSNDAVSHHEISVEWTTHALPRKAYNVRLCLVSAASVQYDMSGGQTTIYYS